jgi:N6-L-threonylcarbamoyladenine synthase
MLSLGYPGGPVIDQLAADGNPEAVKFNDPEDERQSLRF